jgi:hypothetical protein
MIWITYKTYAMLKNTNKSCLCNHVPSVVLSLTQVADEVVADYVRKEGNVTLHLAHVSLHISLPITLCNSAVNNS